MIEDNNNGKVEKVVEKSEFIERNSLLKRN